MNTKYGLTTTEWQIMELMWSTDVPMTFREIMEVARKEWKKEWKVQTLNTFLNGLQKMKLRTACVTVDCGPQHHSVSPMSSG